MFSFILIFIVSLSATAAKVDCKRLLERASNEELRLLLPGKVSHESFFYIQKYYPKILFSKSPPALKTLKALNRKAYAKKFSIFSSHSVTDKQIKGSVLSVQRLLAELPPGGEYTFIGNGMYHAYLAAKVLTSGTAAEKNIHFLPISRVLVRPEHDAELSKYLRSLSFLKGQKTVYVIDSITDGDHGFHLVQTLSLEIAKIRSEKTSMRTQLRSVIPVGIAEEYHITLPIIGKKNLKEYLEVLAKADESETFRTSTAPPPVLFKKLPHNRLQLFYAFSRWNSEDQSGGKYDTFNDKGVPVQTDKYQELISESSAEGEEYESVLNARLSFVYETSGVLQIAEEVRKESKSNVKLFQGK